MVEALLERLESRYPSYIASVVDDEYDLAIKVLRGPYSTHQEFFYKGTCLCRSSARDFSLNLTAFKLGVDYKDRVDKYRDYFVKKGYNEVFIRGKDADDYFKGLENQSNPTPLDYLRLGRGLIEGNTILDSGNIGDKYVYITFTDTYGLYYLYVFKLGKSVYDFDLYNTQLAHTTQQDLEEHLAIIKDIVSVDKVDKSEVIRVDEGNLSDKTNYIVYQLDSGFMLVVYDNLIEEYLKIQDIMRLATKEDVENQKDRVKKLLLERF